MKQAGFTRLFLLKRFCKKSAFDRRMKILEFDLVPNVRYNGRFKAVFSNLPGLKWVLRRGGT
jgi:hypothetical protein